MELPVLSFELLANTADVDDNGAVPAVLVVKYGVYEVFSFPYVTTDWAYDDDPQGETAEAIRLWLSRIPGQPIPLASIIGWTWEDDGGPNGSWEPMEKK